MAQVSAQVPRNQKHPSYSSNPNADIDDVLTDDENSMDTYYLYILVLGIYFATKLVII